MLVLTEEEKTILREKIPRMLFERSQAYGLGLGIPRLLALLVKDAVFSQEEMDALAKGFESPEKSEETFFSVLSRVFGYGIALSEEEEKKARFEETIAKMRAADEGDPRLIVWTDELMLQEVRACERFWRKSTEQHIREHEQNEFEGSPEMRQWHRLAKTLLEKGYSFEDISGENPQ